MDELKSLIRDIPDFPKEGIIFKDITTLVGNPEGWRKTVDTMTDIFRAIGKIDKVVGIEARGFAIAAPLAYSLNAGLVLVRKPGKLPYKTYQETYQLEYGSDTLEIHQDAVLPGERIILVDDLLATGGTVAATARLLEKCGAIIAGIGFIIELNALNGRSKIDAYPCYSLISYD